jgi:ribonuclease-3
MGSSESNERLEFLGDSVLGLVTSEYLYRTFPGEHEGQLTKTKSLLVSKAILSRRALSMGLGRYVLMSHSEVESGGRQRLSILADAFESVIGAIYLDQGFEPAREFIQHWLLRDSREIVADKRHRNYKSHLQEYVQSTFHTHPVYRIRSQMGPDHSKLFLVEVVVGRRVLGGGRGLNKKEAEQAAARDALEKVEKPSLSREADRERRETPGGRRPRGEAREDQEFRAGLPSGDQTEAEREGRRGRRGRNGRSREEASAGEPAQEGPVLSPPAIEPEARGGELEPPPSPYEEDDLEEIGRPEGPHEERRVDPFGIGLPSEPPRGPVSHDESWRDATRPPAQDSAPAWSTSADASLGSGPSAEAESGEEAPQAGVPPLESGPPSEPRFGRRRGRRR